METPIITPDDEVRWIHEVPPTGCAQLQEFQH